MLVSTRTVSGCSLNLSAIFSRLMRTSSWLISFPTMRNGTVGYLEVKVSHQTGENGGIAHTRIEDA